MLLAIDVGNTNIMFALVADGEIAFRWRISTDAKRTADEYAVWLNQLMQMQELDRNAIDDVIIASVVPQTLFNLRGLARRIANVEPMVVGAPGIDYGMPVNLPNPAEVGADRVVNAVAAHAIWPGDLIIIDFGTATTFDVVDTDGAYVGGVIAPGVNLSLEALHMAAAALPHVDVTMPEKVIGTNTVACIQSGIFWGYIGLTQGIVDKIRQERGRAMKVIATGGLAPLFNQGFDLFDAIEDDLTMHGLRLIYDYNNKETVHG